MSEDRKVRAGSKIHWFLGLAAVFLPLALTLFALPTGAEDKSIEVPPIEQASTLTSGGTEFARMQAIGDGLVAKLNLPLKRTEVRAQVTDALAVTDISQVYKNDTGKKIEVFYQFPLPHQGAVTDMVVKINDRTIFGTIKEKQAARKEYEQAKAAGKTVSLVEQERPNIFSQSIANILPDDEITVTLRVFHPLRYSAGQFEYSFPVTIGPRYMGGTPTGKGGSGWSPDTSKTPDASHISPPYIPAGIDSSHLLDIDLTISSQVDIKAVVPVSHYINLKNESKGRWHVTLSPHDQIPNKDFTLRFRTESDLPQFSLLTHRQSGEDGFFALTLVPPSRRQESKIVPKEMVFVLDRSGSMRGVTMAKAKEALVKSLRRLGEQDSFNIILFDDKVESLWDKPQGATPESVRQAVRYAETVDARGGTEMEKPLLKGLAYPEDPKRQRILLFITDGNVGYEKALLAKIRQNLGNSRIFSVGIGSSVNRYLVGEVAREGRGLAEYIRQDEDVAERLNAMFKRISSPVLTDVSIDFGKLETYEVLPAKAHDLFFEEPTTLVGRYRSSGSDTLRVMANSAEGNVKWESKLDFPVHDQANPALRYAWAKKKIDSLSLTALGGETEQLKAEIVALSTRYSVLSRYTAFIAVEREVRDPSKLPSERWLIPSELPEGLEFEGFGPEIQMKVSRVRPGDPVLLVKAPEDARSVVAMMPFGDALNLVYDAIIGKYSARFLVPYGTPDGEYPIDVVITHQDGSVETMDTSYVVDSLPPTLTTRAILTGKRLRIEAVPESDVFVDGAIEIWPDVKEVVAILPDGREVSLKLDPRQKSRWIWQWEGDCDLETDAEGELTVKVRAVDYAGNWKESFVKIELSRLQNSLATHHLSGHSGI